ncbi:MAG: peptidylprolyl isomerase [Sinimarinibacterium sp.]|jgi:hypothetical protein
MGTQSFLDGLSRLQRRHALSLFLALGAALFAVDGLRHRNAEPSVPAGIGETAAGRQWIEDEALYREAVARGLADGDVIVRRRLAQKMRLLLETGVDVGEPSDAELGAWMSERAGQYGAITRLSLDHLFLSRGLRGDGLVADAAAAGERLQVEPDLDVASLGDPHPGGTHLDGIDGRRAERLFGPALAAQFAQIPQGAWQGPLQSSLGLHFVRVRARSVQAPTLASVRDRVYRDYVLAQRELRTQQVVDDLVIRHGPKLAAGMP